VRIMVFNTLGRRLEPFEPFEPPLVRMYTCGPTVYDHTHIGHARMYVSFDGIKRYLELRGYRVIHVQNITDIDDKIINRANETGREWREIADTYAREYLELLGELRVQPHYHPRVTLHIREIIDFIKALIDKGYAYESNGSVYFEVDKYEGYGELVGRRSRDSWRQEEEVASEKRKPYDFALWKRAKPGEPWWDSPWGPGRPGWHIECSVMSSRYLWGQLDIHGGGQDLIFPHHENERAQSEAGLGVRPWVKYWLHAGYLTIRGDKMSKSLGNIIPLKEAIKEIGAPTLRLWILSVHYRSQLEYNEENIRQAGRLYERLTRAWHIIDRAIRDLGHTHYASDEDVARSRRLAEIILDFHKSLSRDFNFGEAARSLWDFTGFVFKELEDTESLALALLARRFIEDVNQVYAFREERREAGFDRGIFEEILSLLVEARQELRRLKMYDASDKIRERLRSLGIELMDYKDRTEWVIKK